ncbi:WXG100 family type VII secretion target [Pseudarthrobacter sp. J1763]|uniref:WXG100 family type VII secretion target n=1 Tax=Pseudarthrobacter sp. J1763 TaxID=3420445 RepID=UPI003D2B87FD
MSFYGMDLEQAKKLQHDMHRASQRLTDLGRQLSPVIAQSSWDGPDGQRFKAEWKSHRLQLSSTAQSIQHAAEQLREDIRQQEEASNNNGTGSGSQTGTSGGSENPLDKIRHLFDGADSVVDTVKDGGSKVLGFLKDQVSDRFDNLTDAFGDQAKNFGNVGDLLWNFAKTGEPPSTTELVASGLQIATGQQNLLTTIGTLGLIQPHVLDDGTPTATAPTEVGVGDGPRQNGRNNTPAPTDLASILSGVSATYGDNGKTGTPDAAIRITSVDKGNGPAYIVSIPGTSEWNVRSGTNPMDTVGNVQSASGSMSTSSEAVELAMKKAGIPEGAPVMLVGHSQGGMTAAALAADDDFRERFNVTNLVTYGAPIDSARVPDSVDTLAIQHQHDVVPRLDLGNSNAASPAWPSRNDASIVTLTDPPGVGATDVTGNHSYNNYTNSVRENEGHGPLADYSSKDSTQQFFSSGDSEVHSSVSGIGREP